MSSSLAMSFLWCANCRNQYLSFLSFFAMLISLITQTRVDQSLMRSIKNSIDC
ncbi:hypothetical protein BCR42DRAFT_430484 [Absidia repens]|uniref:Uncharacterized protein n=1 Tax=Absidia repens TaxID=90262 RepID=A0A1X2HDX6_9FUNG|nr:hypothetical protein BCR42DRAFT_430484 [Absidia repens]